MKRLLSLALLVCANVFAQNAALMPLPKITFLDANGAPVAGGYLRTCVAGTSCTALHPFSTPSNPLATYTDSTAGTAAANPVVLDAGGSASVWLGSGTYKIVLTDANGVTLWTQDNVSAIGLTAGTNAPLGLVKLDGSGLILQSQLNYNQGGIGAVNRSVQSKLQDVVNVADFGAVGDGTTDNYNAFTRALAAASVVMVPAGTYYTSGTLIVPENHSLIGAGSVASVIKNGSLNISVLKVVNAGTSRSQNINIKGLAINSNVAATATVCDFRGVSYMTLDDVRITGNPNGVTTADAGSMNLVDMTYGGASFNGYNRLLNTFLTFGNIALTAQVNQLLIEGGAFNANKTRGIWINNSANVTILGAEVSSNGRYTPATFTADRYNYGGILVETTKGVFIAGTWHEYNAFRESANEYSPNDVEILATSTFVTYKPGRPDISTPGPNYGQASVLGVEYASGKGFHYGNENGLIPNGQMSQLDGSGLPLGWTVGPFTVSAPSVLGSGVSGRRFSASSGFPSVYRQVLTGAQCAALAGKTISVSWYVNLVTLTGADYLRGGVTDGTTGQNGNPAFFVISVNGTGTTQKMSTRYKILGTETNGLSVFFLANASAGTITFELGNISATLSEYDTFAPDQTITSNGGEIWNASGLKLGGKVHGFATTAPASCSQGDIYWNTAPTAAGTLGWVCTAANTPQTLGVGLTVTKNVTGSGGSACTLTYTGGILTASTCP